MNEKSNMKLPQNVRTQPGCDQFSRGPVPGPHDQPPLSSDSGVSRESSFSGSDQLSADVSRNGSFSSLSSGSSPSVSRSCSWRSADEVQEPFNCSRTLKSTLDQPSLLRNARFSAGSRNNENKEKNLHRSSRAVAKRPSIDDHGRSSSESFVSGYKPRLFSPEGLIITTPYQIYSGTNSRSEHTETRRRAVRSADNSPRSSVYMEDEAWMKNCLQILQQSIEKESKDALLRQENEQLKNQLNELRHERDELIRDRDRITCERDALSVERDALRDENEVLKNELENRTKIIHHIQEHLKTTSPGPLHDQFRKKPEDHKPNVRVRSKSDVRETVFFIPEHLTTTNAYTCL